ncbi:hypothetical protein DKY63_23155 [Pseudomonas putida]|uniref:Uncharacterized protein n=1 Tax=Pseudomonas putida TaxID=303 RepID=A0A2Z4RNW3_PSEPU|nr:hypothetical protein DKY63_23155 [Pseudomonas putida]
MDRDHLCVLSDPHGSASRSASDAVSPQKNAPAFSECRGFFWPVTKPQANRNQTVGASLLAMAPCHSTSLTADTPQSRAGSLLQGVWCVPRALSAVATVRGTARYRASCAGSRRLPCHRCPVESR